MGFFDTKQAQQGKANLPEVESCVKQLTALEAEKRELIFQIGQIYVGNADEKTVAGTAYEELFTKLKKAEEEITVLEKRQLSVQELRKCEKCGNVLVLDSVFCNMCGEKLAAFWCDFIYRKYFSNDICGNYHYLYSCSSCNCQERYIFDLAGRC